MKLYCSFLQASIPKIYKVLKVTDLAHPNEMKNRSNNILNINIEIEYFSAESTKNRHPTLQLYVTFILF